MAVGEHGLPKGPGLQRNHREALESRRHDKESAAARASNLSSSERNPRCRIRRCSGLAGALMPTRMRSRPCGYITAYRSKCEKSSLHPLFSSIRPRYSAKGPRTLNVFLNRHGCVRSGMADPTPTTTPGPWRPLTCCINSRSSNELYISARAPRSTGGKIASPIAGSRSAVGTIRLCQARSNPRHAW